MAKSSRSQFFILHSSFFIERMSVAKKLASQTAVYCVSSIVGRVLTYLLVPIYTGAFAAAEYGVVLGAPG